MEVRRLKDKSSPTNTTWIDRARTMWIWSKTEGFLKGKNVTLKKGVEVSICRGGALTLLDHCFIHSNVYFLLTMPKPSVTIGEWVHIGRNTIIASKFNVYIGSHTIFGPNCYVTDHNHGHLKEDIILNQKAIPKPVEIWDDCWIGAGVIVLPGTKIAKGSIIGAGSVVSGYVPPYQIWAGNPARYIKDRE